jgi:hypothetical protein
MTMPVTPSCSLHAHHERVDDRARDRVEAGGGLIVQQVLGPEGDGAGDADALAHAARELGGELGAHVRSRSTSSSASRTRVVDLLVGEEALLAEPHRDVLRDGERVEERGELEDVADLGAQRVEVAARELADLDAIDVHVPSSGSRSPTMCLIATDFPCPRTR